MAPEARTARFRCVLALVELKADPGTPAAEIYQGTCEGRILFAPQGRGGFGYDPLFVPEGQSRSFGELPEEVKNRLSHRARALEKLRQRFESRL